MIVLLRSIGLQEGSWIFVNDAHAQIQMWCCFVSLSFYHLSWKGFNNSIRNSNIVAAFLERCFSVEFLPAWLRVTSKKRIYPLLTVLRETLGTSKWRDPKVFLELPSMHVLSRYPLDRPPKSLRAEALRASKHTRHLLVWSECFLFLLLCMPWICPGSNTWMLISCLRVITVQKWGRAALAAPQRCLRHSGRIVRASGFLSHIQQLIKGDTPLF